MTSVPVKLEAPIYKKGSFDFSASSSTSALNAPTELVNIHKRDNSTSVTNKAKRKKISLVSNESAGKSKEPESDTKQYIVMVLTFILWYFVYYYII